MPLWECRLEAHLVDAERDSIMLKILQVTLLLSLSTPAFAEDAISSFGFTWGSKIEQLPYEIISDIEPTKDKPSNIESFSDSYTLWLECRYLSLEDSMFGTSYSEERTDSYDYASNASQFDASMEGRLRTVAVNAEILGKRIPVCASYFDNRLQSITILWSFLYDRNILDQFNSVFSNKYGNPTSGPFCGFGICTKSWLSGDLEINEVVSGDWTYKYLPVINDKVNQWQIFYDTNAAESAKVSDF